VAGEKKTYRVCEACENLECFKKYVIKKVPIQGGAENIVDLATGGIAKLDFCCNE